MFDGDGGVGTGELGRGDNARMVWCQAGVYIRLSVVLGSFPAVQLFHFVGRIFCSLVV